MEKETRIQRQWIGRLAIGFTLAALALGVMLALTPAGRTLAQNVYRYFVPVSDLPARERVEAEPVIIRGDEVVVPEGSNVVVETAVNEDGSTLIMAEDADTEGESSLDVTVNETENGITTSTSRGGGGGGIAPAMPDLTVESASELVGFAVKRISEQPDGYQLDTIFTPLALPEQNADVPALHFVSLNYSNGVDTIQLMQAQVVVNQPLCKHIAYGNYPYHKL